MTSQTIAITITVFAFVMLVILTVRLWLTRPRDCPHDQGAGTHECDRCGQIIGWDQP